ncbi:unknown [Clostridium sp. CAG:914]|nr:unknown [Clostridium sp. CAG:914]
MIKFTTQKLEMESNLKQRIEFICEFCHIKPTIINSSIKRINNTNLNYLEPHKIIVNNIAFLAFNYSTDIYVGNLSKKIKLVELEDYIKNMA